MVSQKSHRCGINNTEVSLFFKVTIKNNVSNEYYLLDRRNISSDLRVDVLFNDDSFKVLSLKLGINNKIDFRRAFLLFDCPDKNVSRDIFRALIF